MKLHAIAILVALAALSSCSADTAPPEAGIEYDLVTIDGVPLPVRVGAYYVVNASVSLVLATGRYYGVTVDSSTVTGEGSFPLHTNGAWLVRGDSIELDPDQGGSIAGRFAADSFSVGVAGRQYKYVSGR